MPAHCEHSSIGVETLSNGHKYSLIDLVGNSTVDLMAKNEAMRFAPSQRDRRLIATTTKLVTDLAVWIGKCTYAANHFPIVGPDGAKKHIRDSDAKARGSRAKPPSSTAKTEKPVAPSPDSCTSVLSTPGFTLDKQPGAGSTRTSSFMSTPVPEGRRVPKRKRLTQRDFSDRENASFHTYWLGERDLRPPPAPPPVSATERLKALRERLLAKQARRECAETSPVT